ncbi:hypothetical protein GINT2_000257 [Glugoides intestinalis]
MIENVSSIFSKIKLEDGIQVIDLEEDMNNYELLSLLFHKKSIPLDSSQIIVSSNIESRRYFGNNAVCYRCGEIGHLSMDCKQDRRVNCMFCDKLHIGCSCDYLLCDNCNMLGHTFRYCKQRPIGNEMCRRCPAPQCHYIYECPRKWRKYKLLNKNSNKTIIASCPLCFSTSHFLDDCDKKDRKFTIFTKKYLSLNRSSKS